MNSEHIQQPETVGPGQLYFLSHPGSEQFSGYGLTTVAGRIDRLTGLLMIDRPHVADAAWLDRVEAQYGDYQLVPMTATGERGILAQLRIQPGSNRYLERLDHPIAQELKRVLTPFLDVPPSPIFKLRWDASQNAWQSDFWIGLPPDLQEAFESQGLSCMPVERSDGVVTFATRLSDEDTDALRNSPIYFDWQFAPSHTAPLIRFFAAILCDDPYNPHYLEYFLDAADPTQARYLARLTDQSQLALDVYGHDYEYAYSTILPHPAEMRERLGWAIRQAEACVVGNIA